ELGVGAERLAVDTRRFGVCLADDLLCTALGLRADPPQLALHLAEDLLAAPFALGAEACGDALPLRDHSSLDLCPDGVDVVDALDPYVYALDAEARHLSRGGGAPLVLELCPPLGRALQIRLCERVDLFLGQRR